MRCNTVSFWSLGKGSFVERDKRQPQCPERKPHHQAPSRLRAAVWHRPCLQPPDSVAALRCRQCRTNAVGHIRRHTVTKRDNFLHYRVIMDSRSRNVSAEPSSSFSNNILLGIYRGDIILEDAKIPRCVSALRTELFTD